jgi:glycosyltransferase involved in cell wall biosynthesis
MDRALARFRFTSDVKSEKVYEIFESEKPHVFICISQREDVPVSILEAFSFGVPVIATRVGGIAELLTHEKNGLLISANSGPEDLISAIKRIASLNENSYAEMSNCARQTFIDHCQAENNYNAMVYDMFQLSKQHER